MIRRLILITTLVSAAAHADSLRLIAPADRTILRGGHFATLSWTPDQLGKHAEEWEAFLSVDGGRYYSVRLTPHLNINVRTFEFLVPNVDSDDVRLLIRTGNERHESILEMPQRLRIRAEAISVGPSPTRAEGPESARPNEPLVVIWSVGDHVESAATPDQFSATGSPSRRSSEITLVPRATIAGSGGRAPSPVRTAVGGCPPQIPRSGDILLQSSRLNL